ncbi:MAG: Gfo/Idh/MocA family oxidoreductase [Chthonomonadales bacterium]
MNIPEIAFHPSGITRRELLKGSAAIAATLGITLTEAAEAEERRQEGLKEARPVNCAFIGVGAQGYGTDLKRALSVPGVRMLAICDIYEPNLNRALRDVPQAKGYKDFREVMDRKDIEAVLIATPLYEHARIAIAALEAGKHVFCEKMMAYSIEDAKKMARAALNNKRILQIGHQRKSSILYNHGWELLNKAQIAGKVTHVRAQWNRGLNSNWRRPVPPDTDDRHWNWRLYKDLSQGLMAELGTHQIHVVNWYLGAYPTAVVGMGGIDWYKDRTVFDNVEVIFEYPGGRKLNYTSLTTNQYDGFYEQFMGTKGTLIVSQQTGGQFYQEPGAQEQDWMKSAAHAVTGQRGQKGLVLDPEATKKLGQTGVKVGEKIITGNVAGKDDYMLEMEDFFNSIRTGAPVSCDWKQGLAATVAAVRANQAMWEKRRIEIPPSDYEL